MLDLDPVALAATMGLRAALDHNALDAALGELLEPAPTLVGVVGGLDHTERRAPGDGGLLEDATTLVIWQRAKVAAARGEDVEHYEVDGFLVDQPLATLFTRGEASLQRVEIESAVAPADQLAVEDDAGGRLLGDRRGDVGEGLREVCLLTGPGVATEVARNPTFSVGVGWARCSRR